MIRVVVVLAIGMFSLGALAEGDIEKLVAECDRLAASDLDLDRPASVSGVAFQNVDPKAAVAACFAAQKAAPANARVVYQVGRALHADNRLEEARKAYQLGDSLGYPLATYNLGTMFEHGSGVDRDLSEARRLYESAAATGGPMATRTLGHAYRYGGRLDIAADPAQVQYWYARSFPGLEQLAVRGSAFAMVEVGQIHHFGLGAPKDFEKARNWYQKAVDLGSSAAMNYLGALYEVAEGAVRDPVLAEQWYAKAAEAGNQSAVENLRRLRGTVSAPK
jgi:TPR repeat protein